MGKLIYVETSVPSFYHETRPERDIQSRRDWTRQWRNLTSFHEERVTGLPVIAELEETPSPKREETLALIADLRLLPYTSEIVEIVQVYFAHKLMPVEAQGDADHLALASFHNCDISYVELQTSGQCQQIRSHSASERTVGFADACTCHSASIIGV